MRRLTRRQRIAGLVLAVLALCLVTLDLGGGSLRSAHAGVTGALGSLYRGTDTVLGPARRFVAGIPDAGTNAGRVTALEHRNAELEARLAARAGDRKVSAELGALQRAADGSGHDLLPARVLAFGPGQGFDWTVTISAGRHAGVHAGMTVVSAGALVGRVLHASTATSTVLLAVDPQSGVGARDTRTGQIGVASGAGSSGLTFAPVDPGAVLHVGDELVSGPSDASSYVAGLAVGRVTAVHRSASGAQVAVVRPAAPATSLDLVGVVLPAPSSTAAGVVHPRGSRASGGRR